MISHDRKFIFIHIPRTAGTSIEAVLASYVEKPFFSHARAIDYKTSLGKEYDDYYKFVVVRHPVDKLLSVQGFNGKDPLKMSRVYTQTSEENRQNQIDEWGSGNHWLLFQKDYFCDENGEWIVDDIFTFEGLFINTQSPGGSGWERICKKIGIPYSTLPHMRKSKAKKSDLSMEERKILEDFFKDEIEELGYELGDKEKKFYTRIRNKMDLEQSMDRRVVPEEPVEPYSTEITSSSVSASNRGHLSPGDGVLGI